MKLIHVQDLRKYFRIPIRKSGPLGSIRSLFSTEFETKVAVDGISFSVDKGEMVGYIGPNGAGKSTSIKMLTGILVPTEGTIEIAGLVPYKQRKEHVKHIGVVFGQKTQLWWDVPVIDSLVLLKEIYKISDSVYKNNLLLFNDLLHLHEFQNIPTRQLSLGQRMRADLAAAMLHNPDILFLDEPTIGIDVVAKDRFRAFIRSLNNELGVTVLLTTHDMSDIEKVCKRILIIDKGQIIYDGAISAVKEQFAPYRVLEVDFDDTVLIDDLRTVYDSVHIKIIEYKGQQVQFRFNRHFHSASELISSLVKQYPIKDVRIFEPDVESIVKEIYGT